MGRKELAEAIVDFCFMYGIFNNSEKASMSADRVLNQLRDISFVEYLIYKLMTEARDKENVDLNKLDQLVSELENIRLELDYEE